MSSALDKALTSYRHPKPESIIIIAIEALGYKYYMKYIWREKVEQGPPKSTVFIPTIKLEKNFLQGHPPRQGRDKLATITSLCSHEMASGVTACKGTSSGLWGAYPLTN